MPPSMSDDDTTNGTDECNSYPTDFTQRILPPVAQATDPSPAASPAHSAIMPHHHPCPKLEISFGTQTTTDDEFPTETLQDLVLATPVVAQAQPSEAVPLVHAEPVRLEPEPQPVEQIQTPFGCAPPAAAELSIPAAAHRCPDISGLELLSNSIEAFEKHIFIKKEPGAEKPKELYTLPDPPRPIDHHPAPSIIPPPIIMPNVVPITTAPQGSLDILCALAEQRFQEEVGSLRTSRKRSSSSDASDAKRPRKHHKDKHSARKAAKRSKHRKERRDKRRRGSDDDNNDETVRQDLSESFNRVKATLGCSACKHEPGASTAESSSACRCMWPSAEEVYIAMNSDMRNRLAQMAKEVQEEKRKLNEFKTLQSACGGETNASPMRSVSSVSDVKAISDTESFAAFRFGDADADTTLSASPAGSFNKRRADERCSDPDGMVNKKVKSLVEYIIASKNRDTATPDRPSTQDENSQQSSVGASVKQEMVDPNDLFGVEKAQQQRNNKSKHSLKHKKAKSSKERKHRRSSEIRERKRRIDARCTLTSVQLDGLQDKSSVRVLTAMGGLFYAGCLSAVQPPDVYAVTLDGERGNRPHFMSREDVLRDAVSTFV